MFKKNLFQNFVRENKAKTILKSLNLKKSLKKSISSITIIQHNWQALLSTEINLMREFWTKQEKKLIATIFLKSLL